MTFYKTIIFNDYVIITFTKYIVKYIYLFIYYVLSFKRKKYLFDEKN